MLRLALAAALALLSSVFTIARERAAAFGIWAATAGAGLVRMHGVEQPEMRRAGRRDCVGVDEQRRPALAQGLREMGGARRAPRSAGRAPHDDGGARRR